MASSGDMLSIGISGLQASQRNLATAGHNISNVNTDGFSRQSVELATRNPIAVGNGFVGSGVNVVTVKRVYDDFLSAQVTARTSTFNQLDTLQQLASGLDGLLANDDAGLNPALQSFFNALQDAANNPTSIPARQVVILEAETLVDRFASLDKRFEDLRNSVNDQLGAVTTEISNIASSVANLNSSISQEMARSGGQPPNDLLDKRDVLINQLAELVSVSTVDGGDGSINIFIGNGQTLVLGNEANTIGTMRNEFDKSQLEVSTSSGATDYSISSQITGGKLGGLLAFREEIINPVQDSMGRLAIGLAATFNTQHQLGDDINGNAGGLFFNAIDVSSPEVFSSSNNNPASGTVGVAIDDATLLKASDYRLNYDGATFSLRRISDDTIVDSGFAIGDFPRTVAADGLTLTLTGTAAAGDSFLIRPVRNAGNDIDVAIGSAAEFAAATSGNALGDNTNALALAAMQSKSLLGGNTETYQSAYAKLVATVGGATSKAKVNADAQAALLNRAVEEHQSVSGVNLDEEAANLVKFQQAYQAAAQLIRISDEIFQTLINVTGR
ncbi:MAG: flagellar hook-associated protein FlgK [Gammaproteobacteria bacterium]|nr:flagellar hook-associated protein FlgK [Gammaproteobacteria bacterium]